MLKSMKPPKNRRDEIADLLKQLAQKIDSAQDFAMKRKPHQCLVELKSAAMRATRLMTLVSNESANKRLNWNLIVEAIAFIAKVVEKLYSFLRCIYGFALKYENWITHQTSANCGGCIAN